MTDKDNILVERFFQTHPLPQPADEAFVQRVVRCLPQRRRRLADRLWGVCCTVAIVVVFVWADGLALLKAGVGNLLGDLVGCLACVRTAPSSPVLFVACLLLLGGFGMYRLIAAGSRL